MRYCFALLVLLCSPLVGCWDRNPDPVVPIPDQVSGFAVLIVEEIDERDSPENKQFLSVYASTTLRDYLNTHCGDFKNIPLWRIWDKDAETKFDLNADYWQAVLKNPRSSLPWIYILNGSELVFTGPLPGGETETLTLLKSKIGG